MRTYPLRFTFHYVSIKSWKNFSGNFPGLNLHSTMFLLNPEEEVATKPVRIIFTFHYVSIKSLLPHIRPRRQPYLHSTMFLLNLFPLSLSQCRSRNLHSTMFLLNHLEQKIENNDFDIYIPLCFY